MEVPAFIPTSYLLSSSELLLLSCRLASHPISKVVQVPRLNVDRAWPCKATNQAFAALHARHTATAGLLNGVLAVPCHQMAVVDDVLFALLKLGESIQVSLSQSIMNIFCAANLHVSFQ